MKKYCPLPFINSYSELDGFDPCCNWDRLDNNITEVDFDQSFKGIKITEIRNNLLDGKSVLNCHSCYNDEHVGQKSFRQEAIEAWGIVTEPKLKRLDIVFDNICNLKCRGCNSTESHLWYDDEIALYGKAAVKQKYIKNKNYNSIDITNLEQIAISGGEPFFSRDCEKFLENLKEKNILKNISLTFATNSTIIPSKSFHESLLECKDLVVVLSIDGYGSLNEYFRSPSRWDQCVQTMNYFNDLIDQRKNKSTQILVRTTVYVYNVNKLKEIEIFFKKTFPRFEISKRNLCVSPAFLSIKNMPEDLKNLIRPILISYGPEYQDVLNFLNEQGKDLFESFITFHTDLDKIRNESLDTINQLLYNYIEKYKSLNTITKKITLEEAMGNCGLSETISTG